MENQDQKVTFNVPKGTETVTVQKMGTDKFILLFSPADGFKEGDILVSEKHKATIIYKSTVENLEQTAIYNYYVLIGPENNLLKDGKFIADDLSDCCGEFTLKQGSVFILCYFTQVWLRQLHHLL